jgi:L-aminopeptidase/D-esterase-like protein
VRPTREMGEKAVGAASDAAVEKAMWAQAPARRLASCLAWQQAMKSGVGSASLTLGSGVMVAALVVVNAVGDVIDPAVNKIIAGARMSATSREFVDSAAALRHGSVQRTRFPGQYDAGRGRDQCAAGSRADQ